MIALNSDSIIFVSFVLRAQSKGTTQTEAMYINKSLSFLEQTVIALADRKRDHVPFRQTKLTHCLKDSIGGQCNTLLIANVWGEAEQLEETVRRQCAASRASLYVVVRYFAASCASVRLPFQRKTCSDSDNHVRSSLKSCTIHHCSDYMNYFIILSYFMSL